MLPDLPDRGPILPGSWEDLLARALDADGVWNDEAISLYYKVIDGLDRMKPAQLQAREGHLALLREHAARNCFEYLLRTERYDEALALARRAEAWQPEDDDLREMWEGDQIDVLKLARRWDEVLALTRDVKEPLGWLSAAGVLIDAGRLDEAEALLAAHASPAFFAAPLPDDSLDVAWLERSSAARLHMKLAAARRRWDEAEQWFERAHALALPTSYALLPFFGMLVRAGEYQRALRVIEREQGWVSTPALWKGLALRALGRERQARHAWLKALADEENAYAGSMQEMDTILCGYYRAETAADWAKAFEPVRFLFEDVQAQDEAVLYELGADVVFFLSALYEARTGDTAKLRHRLRGAAGEHRAMLRGTRLPAEWWYHVQQLVNPALHDLFREYFETEGL